MPPIQSAEGVKDQIDLHGLNGTTVNRPLNGLTLLKIEYALHFPWRWCPLVLVSFQVFSEIQMKSERKITLQVSNMLYRLIQLCHMRQMFPSHQENKLLFCDTFNPPQHHVLHISDITKMLLLFAQRICSCLLIWHFQFYSWVVLDLWKLPKVLDKKIGFNYKRYTMMELNSRWALDILTWNWHNTTQKKRFMLCMIFHEYQQVSRPSGQ